MSYSVLLQVRPIVVGIKYSFLIYPADILILINYLARLALTMELIALVLLIWIPVLK